jgi:hypothetical protein
MVALAAIERQFVTQTIYDISETEYAFVECKSKVHDGPRKLIENAIIVCQILRDCLKNELDENEKKKVKVDYIEFCKKYHDLLRDLHKTVIGFMPVISECEYPSEILRPIERKIKDFENDIALILHPCNTETFEITALSDILDEYLRVLSPYVPPKYSGKNFGFPKWFISLSFPRAISRNPLLHSITISHEILHLKDHIEGISAGLYSKIVIPQEDFKKLVDTIQNKKIQIPGYENMLMPKTYSELYTRDVLESAIMAKCTDVIEGWLQELVADLLAVRKFGPTYFFAGAEHSLALGVMDRDSDDHPNSRMRLRLMIEELKELGYLKQNGENEKIVNALTIWNNYLNINPGLLQDEIHSVAALSISKMQNTLSETIRTISKDKDYSANKFDEEVWQLVELINNGIPPDELIDTGKKTSKPSTLAGILNAGYMVNYFSLDELGKLMNQTGEEGDISSRRKLDELLLKAIESTEIWRYWPEN